MGRRERCAARRDTLAPSRAACRRSEAESGSSEPGYCSRNTPRSYRLPPARMPPSTAHFRQRMRGARAAGAGRGRDRGRSPGPQGRERRKKRVRSARMPLRRIALIHPRPVSFVCRRSSAVSRRRSRSRSLRLSPSRMPSRSLFMTKRPDGRVTRRIPFRAASGRLLQSTVMHGAAGLRKRCRSEY